MKRILSFLMIGAIASLAIVSCKDDFNEEDFLRLQSELKSQADAERRARDSAQVDYYSRQSVESYISALNEAGDLLAVTFMMRENGNPVEGVAITLTTGPAEDVSSGRAKASQTGTTDASGNVTFDRVVIGGGTVTFSKNGYLTTSAIVNFGTPASPTAIQTSGPNGGSITRYVPPQKRNEGGIVAMFSSAATNENTATISGTVTIETDVTNLTPEVPTGTIIRANLAGLAPGLLPTFMSSFAFADDNGIGVAEVNANGSYQMRVPATAAGTPVTFIIPNIEGTRRTAVNGYDDGTGAVVTLVNGPEYRQVPVSWGPQSVGVSATIPSVVGARVIIPTPPAAGTGLTFDFVRVPRALETVSITSEVQSTTGDMTSRITNRGNYGTSLVRPSVQFNGGGGTGATGTAILRTYLSSVQVTNPGSGYIGNVTLQIRATLANGSTQDISTVNLAPVNNGLQQTIDLESVDNATDGFGQDEPIDLTIANFANVTDFVSISLVISAPGAGGTQATAMATFVTELDELIIVNGGFGYTTPPTIALTGGGAGAQQPLIDILDLQTYWDYTPNNSASSGYAVLPANFNAIHPPTNFDGVLVEALADLIGTNGIQESADKQLEDFLTVQNGNVVMISPGLKFRTNTRSSAMPWVEITPVTRTPATAVVLVNGIDAATGTISSSSISPTNTGAGYGSQLTATIQPSISGAPGSGATVLLSNTFNSSTKEWSWNGGQFTITNGGTGYLRNLNQKQNQGSVFSSGVTAQAGKNYVVNFAYGTGQNQVNIN